MQSNRNVIILYISKHMKKKSVDTTNYVKLLPVSVSWKHSWPCATHQTDDRYLYIQDCFLKNGCC